MGRKSAHVVVNIISDPPGMVLVLVNVSTETKTTVIGVAVGATMTVTVPPPPSAGFRSVVGADAAMLTTVKMSDWEEGAGSMTTVSAAAGGTIVKGHCTPDESNVTVIVSDFPVGVARSVGT